MNTFETLLDQFVIIGGDPVAVSPADLTSIEERYGILLPEAYGELLQAFGVGIFNDFLRLHAPAQITTFAEDWADYVNNNPSTRAEMEDFLIFATSVNGDEVGWSRRDLARSSSSIRVSAGREARLTPYAASLEEMVANMAAVPELGRRFFQRSKPRQVRQARFAGETLASPAHVDSWIAELAEKVDVITLLRDDHTGHACPWMMVQVYLPSLDAVVRAQAVGKPCWWSLRIEQSTETDAAMLLDIIPGAAALGWDPLMASRALASARTEIVGET